jgi:hypothetical protein
MRRRRRLRELAWSSTTTILPISNSPSSLCTPGNITTGPSQQIRSTDSPSQWGIYTIADKYQIKELADTAKDQIKLNPKGASNPGTSAAIVRQYYDSCAEPGSSFGVLLVTIMWQTDDGFITSDYFPVLLKAYLVFASDAMGTLRTALCYVCHKTTIYNHLSFTAKVSKCVDCVWKK